MDSSTRNRKLLTVLIPFKNEKEEVAMTCRSVRDTAGDRVDIIVLNDDSQKGFDYKRSLMGLNVDYYETSSRLGSSAGKQRCVELCKTPYFLILDAHCRMYTYDWLDKALSVLQKDEDCVYCCAVQYFSTEKDHLTPAHVRAYGGFWDYNTKSILSCAWNITKFGDEEFEVPCILGANYLCSKRWWDKIGGYNGLLLYGREETFISLKSRMAGGSVKCIPQIVTGHKTRPGHQPYRCLKFEVVHNEMAIALITQDDDMFQKICTMLKRTQPASVFKDADTLLHGHLDELYALKNEFEKLKKVTQEEVDVFNTDFQRKIGFVRYSMRK